MRNLSWTGGALALLIATVAFATTPTRSGDLIRARCATTGHVALTGLQTIDGVTEAAGDIVLVDAQTDAAANDGLYVAQSTGWTRLLTPGGATVLQPGLIVPIMQGTRYGGSTFVLATTTSPIVVGSTPLTFSLYNLGEALQFSVSAVAAASSGVYTWTGAVKNLNGASIAGVREMRIRTMTQKSGPTYVSAVGTGTLKRAYSAAVYTGESMAWCETDTNGVLAFTTTDSTTDSGTDYTEVFVTGHSLLPYEVIQQTKP